MTKKTLPNGLTMIHVPMQSAMTATVLVLVAAGSEYETKEESGISHFLEHMCFKGTEKRKTAYDITLELDTIGSASNAFTDKEYTGYYAKADAAHWKKMLDILSDIYLHATLPDAELQKEKGVIIEEINMYEDMPQYAVHDLFAQALYGDTPAGRPIIGPKENILKFTREAFIKYRTAHYVPEATTVVISGNVPEDEAFANIEAMFGGASANKKRGKEKVIEAQTQPAVLLKQKETDQAHLVLGVRTIDVFDKRTSVASVVAGVLSGGMSSRLFQKLREDMGVCYYVRASHDASADHGVFSIAAGVDTKRIEEVVGVLIAELQKLKTALVGDEELKKVKAYIIGNTKMQLESTDAVAEWYGFRAVLGRPLETPEETIAKIEAVTPQDIMDFAKTFFKKETLNLAAVSRHADPAPFKTLLDM